MFLNVGFEQFEGLSVDGEFLLLGDDLLLLNFEALLVEGGNDAGELEPAVAVGERRELADTDVDGLAIVRDQQCVRQVQLDKFVGHDAEHEGQRVRHLRELQLFTRLLVRPQHQREHALLGNLVDYNSHRVLYQQKITKFIYSCGLIRLDFSQGFC